MTNPSTTVNDAIDVLNSAMLADPHAMDALLKHRVPCNDKLGDHPTIQCGQREVSETGTSMPKKVTTVGILGIINGIFGLRDDGSNETNWGFIAAIVNDAGEIQSFIRSDKCTVDNSHLDDNSESTPPLEGEQKAVREMVSDANDLRPVPGWSCDEHWNEGEPREWECYQCTIAALEARASDAPDYPGEDDDPFNGSDEMGPPLSER